MNNYILFIWIPKNGGGSLTKMLNIETFLYYSEKCKNLNLKVKNLEEFKKKNFYNKNISFGHTDPKCIVKYNLINQEYYNNLYKICIIRNPYDRAVSIYFYLKKRFPKQMKKFNNFPEYIRYIYINKHNIPELDLESTLENNNLFTHCNPQYKWVEKIKLNYIIKFENYEEDLNILLKNMNIKIDKFINNNKSNRDSNYKIYYDNDTIKYVNDLYKIDFIKFNYKIYQTFN
jgi:hypothetical protein